GGRREVGQRRPGFLPRGLERGQVLSLARRAGADEQGALEVQACPRKLEEREAALSAGERLLRGGNVRRAALLDLCPDRVVGFPILQRVRPARDVGRERMGCAPAWARRPREEEESKNEYRPERCHCPTIARFDGRVLHCRLSGPIRSQPIDGDGRPAESRKWDSVTSHRGP